MQTALHLAAFAGRKGVVKLLLESGAITGERNGHGRTELDLALLFGDEAVPELPQLHMPREAYES